MSLFKMFKTDANLEMNGVVIDYGETRVTLARSGGANKQYLKVLEAKTKPFRRAIQADMMDRKKLTAIMQDVFIEAAIRKWEELVDGEWQADVVRLESGEIVPFSRDAVLSVFRALPDLFEDLQSQSANMAIYRQADLEEDVKN